MLGHEDFVIAQSVDHTLDCKQIIASPISSREKWSVEYFIEWSIDL